MRPFAFFFHYNKPATLKAGKVQVSLHFKGQCHILDNVKIGVPTNGRLGGRSPRFVVSGKANKITIKGGIGYIE